MNSSNEAFLQVDAIQRRLLEKVDGVLAVHEFHVWQLAGDRIIASAHIRWEIKAKTWNTPWFFITREINIKENIFPSKNYMKSWIRKRFPILKWSDSCSALNGTAYTYFQRLFSIILRKTYTLQLKRKLIEVSRVIKNSRCILYLELDRQTATGKCDFIHCDFSSHS